MELCTRNFLGLLNTKLTKKFNQLTKYYLGIVKRDIYRQNFVLAASNYKILVV